MEQKNKEELEREVQSVYSEKSDDAQVQTENSDNNELSNDDLGQVSGGLNIISNYETRNNKPKADPVKNCWKKY